MQSPRTNVPLAVHALAAGACLFVHVTGVTSAQPKIPPVQVAPPGETGRRITDEALLANYFPSPRKAPAVLVLGGSVGGLSPEMNNVARALQSEGFGALHLSYFRGPGQQARLELIPLEYFATALAWLRRQPETDPARVGVVGGSKGAEAALLVAARHPEINAVIAALPSSVVWPGIIWEGTTGPIRSSWSERGEPLPHIPHVPYGARKSGTMADNFAASLQGLSQHPETVIPVERIAGWIMLVCGEADRISPSCPMARQIERRLREHRRPAAILLAYQDAGHAAFGLPLPPDDPRLTSAGGTVQGTSAARSDSWQRAIAFLKARLGN